MAIGNSCDFARELEDVPWSQVVPLVTVPWHISATKLAVFRRYQYSRSFYIPPWPESAEVHRFADFTRPVTVHKSVFSGPAKVIARMQYPAWVLLHSCLIRFLARDDGRQE